MENKNEIKKDLIEKHLKRNIKVRIGKVSDSDLPNDKKFYFPVFDIKEPLCFFSKKKNHLGFLNLHILNNKKILKIIRIVYRRAKVFNMYNGEKIVNEFLESNFFSKPVSLFVRQGMEKPLVENHGYINDIAFETKEELIDFLKNNYNFYNDIIYD